MGLKHLDGSKGGSSGKNDIAGDDEVFDGDPAHTVDVQFVACGSGQGATFGKGKCAKT